MRGLIRHTWLPVHELYNRELKCLFDTRVGEGLHITIVVYFELCKSNVLSIAYIVYWTFLGFSQFLNITWQTIILKILICYFFCLSLYLRGDQA